MTVGGEAVMAGIDRMHFYRLTGSTPEEATDEQVERFFALRSQEDETGERVTEKLAVESATDMVTRELKIINLPQVMDPGDPLEQELNQPSLARRWVSKPVHHVLSRPRGPLIALPRRRARVRSARRLATRRAGAGYPLRRGMRRRANREASAHRLPLSLSLRHHSLSRPLPARL